MAMEWEKEAFAFGFAHKDTKYYLEWRHPMHKSR